MAEEFDPGTQPMQPQQPQTGGAPGQEQFQTAVDDRDMRNVYANTYRVFTTDQEVVLELGFMMPHPYAQPQQRQLLLKVNDRVSMSYITAKRLMLSLQQLVKRFEQQFGEIPVQPGPRK